MTTSTTPRTTARPASVPAPAPASAEQILARCRDLVRPGLATAVGRLHPWPRDMAAHALGSGGKGVRQALAVLAAEACGAPAATAVPGAVAVELIHTFSLVHDDIMDGDELRRCRPAVWKAYGTGPAVLAGDALFALALTTLTDAPTPHAPAALGRLATALTDLVAGQAEDLLFESRPWTGPHAVRLHEYRTMAERKTGALLGCATALGAVLAGAPAPTVAALSRAGRHLGLAFQAVDDLLGIWGDPATTGKPVHNDLRRLKKTFPVLTALAEGGPPARQLAALLTSPGFPDDAGRHHEAAALVEQAGGRAATLAEAHRQLAAARDCLDGVPLAPGPADDIRTLLPFLVDRQV